MPTAIQIITYKIHGQRKLLVPSIMLRRSYLATAHLDQIESEMQALQSRGIQIENYSSFESAQKRLKAMPNYDNMPEEEREQRHVDFVLGDSALVGRMNIRMAHLKAMKKNIIQFKLN